MPCIIGFFLHHTKPASLDVWTKFWMIHRNRGRPTQITQWKSMVVAYCNAIIKSADIRQRTPVPSDFCKGFIEFTNHACAVNMPPTGCCEFEKLQDWYLDWTIHTENWCLRPFATYSICMFLTYRKRKHHPLANSDIMFSCQHVHMWGSRQLLARTCQLLPFLQCIFDSLLKADNKSLKYQHNILIIAEYNYATISYTTSIYWEIKGHMLLSLI